MNFHLSIALSIVAAAFFICDLTSVAAQQQVVTTPEGIFTTRENPSSLPMPSDEATFQFVIFGDRTGGDPSGLKVLDQAISDTNLLDPDFVLTVGDLIQGYNKPAEWQVEADEFIGYMKKLSMPWFPVAGNHDIYWEFKDPERPEYHHEKNYEANFGPLWYSFRHKQTGFIVLYSDEGDLETGEKGFNQGRMQNMSPEQMAFLKSALDQYQDLKQVFVALHHPRWIGGGYAGNNWPEIHNLLVEAGNVKAVFAGHIHRMRYDPADGIDYFALATTGGHLSADSPQIGYLHHFNVVTVRPDGFSVATVPVGSVMDPKQFSAEFLTDVRRVQQMRPQRSGDALHLSMTGETAQHYRVAIPNAGKYPVEVEMVPQVSGRWRVVPDHQHVVIPPGKTDGMEFYFFRDDGDASTQADAWQDFRTPALKMTVDYLHESARIRMPPVMLPIDADLTGVADNLFNEDLGHGLMLGGEQTQSIRREVFNIKSDCARISSADTGLLQGPFTLEAWVNPSDISGSRAIVAKTQSSEYALFMHDGFPQFDVHLGKSYVSPKSDTKLPLDQWTHVAGVYDGETVRLYIDGKLTASVEGSGERTLNNLPLYVGADPDGSGSPTRQFSGMLDEVRLSQGVRYAGDFQPSWRFQTDPDTRLLLHLDRATGPFLHDDSQPAASVEWFGGAAIQPVTR